MPQFRAANFTSHLVLLVVLLGLGLVVFQQSVGFDFTNLDDNVYVTANPDLERGLTADGLRWAFTTRHGNLYMPATWISFLADRQFTGPGPAGFHRTNVLLHLVNTLLLYFILWRIPGTTERARWAPFWVAALFAIHPLHVESVAWIAERKDVLSGFFFLLAIRFWLGFSARMTAARYVATLVCFALALLSKPMAVTLPAVLLLLDFRDAENRRPLRTILLEKIPFLALSAALAVITYRIVQTRDIGAPDPVPLLERLGQAVVYTTLYLAKAVYPAGLSVFYPPETVQYAWPRILLWAFLLVCLTGAAWQQRNRVRAVWIGWLWYLVMLLPVLDVVQGGMQVMSDRYFYLPSIGLFLAAAWLAARFVEMRRARLPWLRWLVGAAAVASIAAFTVTAQRQATVWQDTGTLFRHALAVNEENYLAHANLGSMLNDAGRPAEALPHLERAVEMRPDALHQFNLANALSKLGRREEAIGYFRGAIALQPDFPVAHNNLGIALWQSGERDAAERHFTRAVEQDPRYAGAHFNLGMVLLVSGRADEARASFEKCVAADPGHEAARQQLRELQSAGD